MAVAISVLAAWLDLSSSWQERMSHAQVLLLMVFILVVVPFDTRDKATDKYAKALKIISYLLLIVFILIGGMILLAIIAGNMGILENLL